MSFTLLSLGCVPSPAQRPSRDSLPAGFLDFVSFDFVVLNLVLIVRLQLKVCVFYQQTSALVPAVSILSELCILRSPPTVRGIVSLAMPIIILAAGIYQS